MSAAYIRLILVMLYHLEEDIFDLILAMFDTKIEWVELKPKPLPLTPEQEQLYCLPLTSKQRNWPFEVYLNLEHYIEDPKLGFDIVSDTVYEEDGTAVSYEERGHWSKVRVRVIGEDVHKIFNRYRGKGEIEGDDVIKSLAVPITCFMMASYSYSYGSDNGASTDSTLSDNDYCSLTLEEIEHFMTKADYPLSILGLKLVRETDQEKLASLESQRKAFGELCKPVLGFKFFKPAVLKSYFEESL